DDIPGVGRFAVVADPQGAAFSGVKTCPGIRKSVRFKLAGGAAIIQLSGAKKADLKVAVLTPE
ncbi:hypothetical protein FJ471_23945, partial [Mesorhizobium sp. B2-7-1]